MPLSPVGYANRYLNLQVPFDDGTTSVRISKYHIGSPKAEQGALWQALKEHFLRNQRRDASWRLRLRVNSETAEFSSAHDMLHRAANPFWGKGSPEDCQIVLQLAVILGRVPGRDSLQAYADNNLGLDCNGFVGNYLFRVVDGNGWRSDASDRAIGPSSTITQIMEKPGRVVIKSPDEIMPAKIHILGEVDGQYKTMPGGPSAAPGHIVMTEPGRYRENFMSMDLDLADQGVLGSPALWCTESAGGSGLVQSWYTFTQLRAGGRTIDGVFRVHRGNRGRFLNFRVIALG